MQLCPSCGLENADTARFCSECGVALSTPPPGREERKVVTVVFADIVGSTARAERLDPEDVRAILEPYHDRLRNELERHGGVVEKFIGDAVVGIFGAPVSHEDDPERAVRSALAIQQAIRELNAADANLELEVRIGVNTGEALVVLAARPELGEAAVTGDVMNTAARLQSAAPSGGILVAESTYRVTARAIEYTETQPFSAKGKSELVRAWLAVAPRARLGVDVSQSGRAPLVGRERELDLLLGALRRACAEREPQLVTLVGVPGIGKSRLVWELSRAADDDPELITWRQGRSLSYGQGVAFWAVGEIVKAQAGILESDDSEATAGKLSAAVRDLLDETEHDWVERSLRPLVGLGGEVGAGREQQAEVFAAWRRFFEGLATASPAVLVFEDLHWADEGVLDFVDLLSDRVVGVPLLLVCTGRPELLERRPGWGGGKRNAVTVSLTPLSDEETGRLIVILLDRGVRAAEEQAALLQRAGGNPLYAEEYARMLADGAHTAGEVPETLQGVVAARIDGLPDDEKQLLQHASVLGKVFWTDALAALTATDDRMLEDRLHALERKEFVRREQRSAVAGAHQYVFVHALVRDGAYGQMPRAVRARAHERAAGWIESLPADRAEDRAEMLAHHLLQAVDYARASGLDVTALEPRTAVALREAGERAWALGAAHAALEFFERTRSLDPSAASDPWFLLQLGRALMTVRGSGDDELERAALALADSDATAAAEAEIALGEALWQRGDTVGGFRHFDRAGALVESLGVSLQVGWVIAQRARFLALAGRQREAGELAGRAVEIAEELGDPELLGDVLNTRAIVRSAFGEPGWVEDLERSLALALERNSWRASRAYLNLAATLMGSEADLRRAESLNREGLAFALERGGPTNERWFRGNLADCLYHLGAWEEALRLASTALADPEPHYSQPGCRSVRARIRLARGDIEGALTDARTAVEEARAIRDPQTLIPALGTWVSCLALVGDRVSAEAVLEELITIREHLEFQPTGPELVEVAVSLYRLDRERELLADAYRLGSSPWSDAALAIAREDAVHAADLLGAKDAASLEALVRFVAAKRLHEQGLRAEAREQLELARAFYSRVGAYGHLREADGILAAAS